MSEIIMEAIESALISHRGHDAEKHIMTIRFRTKTGVPGSVYEYANVSPKLYADAIAYKNDKGEVSFGQFMNRYIKADPKRYPFRKLEEIGESSTSELHPNISDNAIPNPAKKSPLDPQWIDGKASMTDFTSGQPLPATTQTVVEPIPTDEEALKTAAEELNKKALTIGEVRRNAIIIGTIEAYELAAVTGNAIARMRAALESTMRPKIKELYAPYKAALEILNKYDGPLEQDEKRLKEGMRLFKQEQDRARIAEQNRIRREQEAEAERVAAATAQQLQLADAIEAEQRGETELAQQIIESKPLPIAPAYIPPVNLPSAITRVAGETHKEDWAFEWVDENGDPVQTPRIDLIPSEYLMIDEKAIAKVVKTLKGRTLIKGVRAYDRGAVSFSKK